MSIIANVRDLITCTPRGCGKTASFMIPIIEWLLINSSRPRIDHLEAVIMSTNEELALTIGAQSELLIHNTNILLSLTSNFSRLSCTYWLSLEESKIIAQRRICLSSKIKYLFFDEADRLLGTCDLFTFTFNKLYKKTFCY